jgi:hypothetical protein
LLQSSKDEFVLKKGKVKLPVTAGSILSYKGEGVKCLSPEKQCDFQSGAGKLLHLSKWSRPKIKNAVCELSRGMTQGVYSDAAGHVILRGDSESWNTGGIRRTEEWLPDMTYTSEYDTRHSVMG